MSPIGMAANAASSNKTSNNLLLFGKTVYTSEITAELLATINIYYTPLLILFGCFGNLLSIFVFYTSKLRLQSTSVYLSALALSDTLFLIQLFPPWLDAVQFTNTFSIPAICYSVTYLSYVTCCMSTWIVVAFTVERLLAVLYPLRRSLICTVTRAKSIVLFLTCIFLVFNVPVLIFVTPLPNCSIASSYHEHATYFNIADTAISFTLPLGAIILLNLRIMKGVWKLESSRLQLLKNERHPSVVLNVHPSVSRCQHRVTRMLLLVSSVYVVLNLPAYTMRILAYTMGTPQSKSGAWSAFQQGASIFFNTNFGINFLLYCLSGQNFRQALYEAIPWLQRSTNATTAARNTSYPTRSITTFEDPCVQARNRAARRQAPIRRHRSEPVIRRWIFDNSRQRVQPEEIEMTTYRVDRTT